MRSLVLSTKMYVLSGLRLAGIQGVYCKDIDELKKNFNKHKKDKDIGILIFTEEDFHSIEDIVEEFRINNDLPLIATISDKSGFKDKDFLMKYIKESIGLKIE